MIQRLYAWYGKKTVWGIGIVIVVLLVIALIVARTGSGEEDQNTSPQLRTVATQSIASLSSQDSITVIGTAEAVNQSTIESEVSGRIVSVPVELGDTVAAGTLIAQIENAAERAAVLQAEGAYEIALAQAAQSDVSVTDAQTTLTSELISAITTHRSSFTTADDIIKNTADNVFSNPYSSSPGLRIDGRGDAIAITQERVAVGEVLEAWSERVGTTDQENVVAYLEQARIDTLRISALIELLANLIAFESEDSGTSSFTEAELASFRTTFLTARTNLNLTLSNIESALEAIDDARERLASSELSGTNAELSAANAAVKQALGSLQNAEAALAKTLIRSPLSGTVNALNVDTGDFVGAFDTVAVVANNNALEITAFFGESDREQIAIGDTVIIERSIEGRIARIAPAVNPDTKKVEVKIQTDSDALENGDTVRVMITPSEETIATSNIIRVPLTAIKFTADDAFVFTVSADGVLRAQEVTLGKASGTNITITDGVSFDTEIVVDARGLNDGVRVNVADES